MAVAARIQINRAPVLTLWAAVVAERLGYDREEALTLGRAVAGLNAQSKGRRLGINRPAEPGRGKPRPKPAPARVVELLHRAVPVARTPGGLRALNSDGSPADPESVERYLVTDLGHDAWKSFQHDLRRPHMKIGILGSGAVGQALGGGFAALGHEVKLGTREPWSEKPQAWATRTGPKASVGSFRDAAAFAEVAI